MTLCGVESDVIGNSPEAKLNADMTAATAAKNRMFASAAQMEKKPKDGSSCFPRADPVVAARLCYTWAVCRAAECARVCRRMAELLRIATEVE